MSGAWENRIDRKNAKSRKKYKPVKHSSVGGFTKQEWYLRKKKGLSDNNDKSFSFSRSVIYA